MANFNRIEVHAVDHCTLSCIGCNHGSPHLTKKSYMVEDYTVWFDLLINKGHRWRSIGISGGEPFLLLNKINEFCQTLKQKYKCPIHIFTNGFWLNSERCIDDYSVCFSNIDSLQISFYKPYVEKIGIEKMKSTLDLIKNKYNIRIYSFKNEGVKKFGQVYFYDIPVKMDEKHQCVVKDCTQLRSDGKLYRCTYGNLLETKIPSEGFKQSKDIVFDLKKIDEMNLTKWLNKWPLDSCSFCGCGKSEIVYADWESDPSIKDMNRSQYLKVVKNMIGNKNIKNLKNKKFL